MLIPTILPTLVFGCGGGGDNDDDGGGCGLSAMNKLLIHCAINNIDLLDTNN